MLALAHTFVTAVWPVFGCVKTAGVAARFASGKNIPLFIRAAALIQAQVNHVQFVAIGSEGYPGGNRDLAAVMEWEGVNESMHLMPPLARQDLVDAYACMDVIVFPSTTLYETFGIVNLEAMAMKVPVVHFGFAGMQVRLVKLC